MADQSPSPNTDPDRITTTSDRAVAHPALAKLDQWMAQNPWHPRFVPFLLYVGVLPVVVALRDWLPATYPLTYTIQCVLVLWLLWRYRKLMPELNLNFHWLALPVGAAVAVAWIWLGLWVANWDYVQEIGLTKFTQDVFASLADPQRVSPYADSNAVNIFDLMGNGVGWVAFLLRLAGMSIVVPLFEELFIRSLLLRSLQHFRPTMIGILQIIQDTPVIGEWLMHTSLGTRADRHGPMFGPQFERTPLGALSVFGVAISTVVFTAHHIPRDWLGCVVCALAYCLLLAATRRKGLGPVCWAHGITNALLWAYTLRTGDWQFL